MYIIWDEQIDVGKFTKENGIKAYKYKRIFSEWIEEILGNTSSIVKIKIEEDKKSYGTTKPQISDNGMKFCIELSSELLSDIYSAKSKSIFQHEIYHCKDILVLYKNGIIDKKLLHSKIHTTYDYILDLSLKEWSEFYAVYSTVKSNGWYETYTIDLDIESIANVIDEIHANSRKGFSMQLSKNMLCAIRSFIYDMVTMIGIYLVTGNFDIIRQYTESNEKFVADYFNLILNVLQTKLSKYPEWVNKEQFVALGRDFLNILTLNGILYSTDDLHDGLYFKCNI